MKRYARWFLLAMVLIPVFCLAYIAYRPPPNWGFFSEQALLFCIALAALWLSRHTPTAAITLYCLWSLFPVVSMIEYQVAIESTWIVFVLTPFVGVFVVAAFAESARAVLIYTAGAMIANCAIGMIYNELGQTVAMTILTGITAGVKTIDCRKWQKVVDALTRLGIIERGLSGIRGDGNK